MFVTQAITTSEFRTVLEKALVKLPSSTRDARELVYRRARASLVTYMRADLSPASEERIREESRRLEEVIRQVEAEFERATNTAQNTQYSAPPREAASATPNSPTHSPDGAARNEEKAAPDSEAPSPASAGPKSGALMATCGGLFTRRREVGRA